VNKTIFYIDMDGVLADFCSSPAFKKGDQLVSAPPRMFEIGFFEHLPPIDGALWAVRSLMKNPDLDIYILTQPVKDSICSYSEKAAWVAKWLPELSLKLILTQNKELLSKSGSVLVDDAAWKWKEKWEAGGGTFIHFNIKNYDTDRPSENGVDSPRRMWEMISNVWGIKKETL
jgi:hypothetical protein